MSEKRKLEGKTALITGGNSGIGLATARLFVEEGARVAITGRDKVTLDAAVKELGPQAIAFQSDVIDEGAREHLFRTLTEQFGRLDILFANAGIGGSTPVGSTAQEVFELILRVNVTGAFMTVQSALPLLGAGSTIVLNSSIASAVGSPGHSAYGASKAGLRAVARSLASELSSRGIRVNVVSPGPIRTPIWGRTRPKDALGPLEKYIETMIPLRRMGEAEEVAKAVLFLASSDSSYIQGAEIVVDGGFTGAIAGSPRLLSDDWAIKTAAGTPPTER